jgi:hypothetical protein
MGLSGIKSRLKCGSSACIIAADKLDKEADKNKKDHIYKGSRIFMILFLAHIKINGKGKKKNREKISQKSAEAKLQLTEKFPESAAMPQNTDHQQERNDRDTNKKRILPVNSGLLLRSSPLFRAAFP